MSVSTNKWGVKTNSEHHFYAEFVADITTRYSEQKDLRQDKMLDIIIRKQTQTTQYDMRPSTNNWR